MPSLRIEGFELYYEVHGEGFPVVLAHGVGGNHAGFYQQVPAFSARYKTVLFDHRGFGNSRDAPNGPGRARFVPDLLALLDHLNLGEVALVAQSMGGGTCAHLAWRHPQRVKALVLADTLIGLKLPADLQARLAEIDKGVDGLSQLERVLGASFRRRDPAGCQLYSQIASFNQVNRRTLAGSLGEGPTAQDLGALGKPILFLVGEEDVLFPPALVEDFQRRVQGSRFLRLPGAGHSAYFEAAQAFNDAVLRFLAETV